MQRDKDDILRYGNESLLELLSVVDNLDMALRHSADAQSRALLRGVEMTMREFRRVLRSSDRRDRGIRNAFRSFASSCHDDGRRPDIDEMTVVGEKKGLCWRQGSQALDGGCIKSVQNNRNNFNNFILLRRKRDG